LELREIIDSVDIVEYIGQYLELEERNGEFLALCPFHSENTESFTVTPSTQLYCCFGCKAGGNVLTFIQNYHKCDFSKAVRMLKEFANITDDYVDLRLSATKTIKKFKPSKSRKPDVKHKILSPDIMIQYEKELDKLKIWANEGITYEVMEKYQVRYDPFSNRIVYPIRDLNGNIISIKGRTLDPDFKAKKLRKYTYFEKIGDLDTIFGYYEHLQDILNKKEIVLFEGEKSVMLAESWGITNTAAILTSHLNPFQLPILIKLGVRVVFALDEEVNITEDENIKKLSRFVEVEYIKDNDHLLDEKAAPVDHGQDIWERLYEGRKSLN